MGRAYALPEKSSASRLPPPAYDGKNQTSLPHVGPGMGVFAVNDEPPVDSSNWLHHALVGLDRLTRIPSSVLALAIVVVSALVGGTWYVFTGTLLISLLMGGAYLVAIVADWIWLAGLPKRHISFGPVEPPLLGLGGVRLFIAFLPLIGWTVGWTGTGCVLLGMSLHLLLSALVLYATGVEPFRLGTTPIELFTSKLPAGKRVRLVQISDLHVERLTRRERQLIQQVNELNADYVLLTGDYLNFSYVGEAQAIADARQVLGALKAREGIFATRGTHQVDPNALLPVLFEGLPIRWLRSEHVTARRNGFQIAFAGASCTRKPAIDVPAVRKALAGVPAEAFTVLLYHTPELVSEAAAGGADLYLSGHTHGGQIRLPLYGALFTATDTGKRYEMGRYDTHHLTLYVSRGVGMEGRAAPRARFLCPPEIVCVDVKGTADKT